MKIRLTLFLLCLFVLRPAIGQHVDLEIYSHRSDSFHLWINGVKQSPQPRSNYDFFNLPVGYYEAMITVPDQGDTVIKPLSMAPNAKTTYVLKQKRNGAYKLRFRDETPLAETPGTKIVAQTPGAEASMNPKPVHHHGIRQDVCMQANAGYNEIKNIQLQVQHLQFDESKLNEIRQLLQGVCFYTMHGMNLTGLISNPTYKLELAKLLLQHTVDKDNASVYAKMFTENDFQTKYLDYWEANR